MSRCLNVFTHNDRDFVGPSLPGNAILRATPCFADFVEKKSRLDPGIFSCASGFDKTVINLERSLLAEEDLLGKSNELRDWRLTLDTLTINSEERKLHFWWLSRKGLSNQAGIDFFYSFCKKEWVNEGDYRHSPVCRNCYSVHVSWHYGVCK